MRPSRWKHMERLRQVVANTGQKVGSRKVPGYRAIIDIVIANTGPKMNGLIKKQSYGTCPGFEPTAL